MAPILRLLVVCGLLAFCALLALQPPQHWAGTAAWTIAIVVALGLAVDLTRE